MDMTGKEIPPDCKYMVFHLNPETHYFEMIRSEMGFFKVPNELKLEETQRREQINSEFIIQSRIKNGKRDFFTGIINTKYPFWYFGDFFEIRNGIKRNSFILFHFSTDLTRFEMYFFNHFKLYPKNRGHFINLFLSMVKRNLYPSTLQEISINENKKEGEYPTLF